MCSKFNIFDNIMKTQYNFNIILYFLPVLIILSSCGEKKKYRTTISGLVIEKNGSRIVGGSTVYLIENEYHPYNTAETILDSVKTGPSGMYFFDFNHGEGYYKVAAYAENYYTNNTNGNLRENIITGETQSLNIELWPYAWLKVRFVNSGSYLGVDVNPYYGEIFGFQIRSPDSTVIGLTKGNTITDINYFTIPGSEHNRKSINCPGLDTTYLEITY